MPRNHQPPTIMNQPATTNTHNRVFTDSRRPLPSFPQSVLQPRRLRWRHRLRVLATCTAVVSVVAAGALIGWRVRADDGPNLRTATATTQTVAEHYQAVGAIEPVSRAQVTFPVSGTVDSVGVAVGDTVEIGDTLASIDTTDLEQALRQAESTLASARLTLNIALTGEDPSSSGAGGLGGSTGAVGASASGDATFEFASTDLDAITYVLVGTSDDVAAARQAVASAQSAVNSATNTVAAKRDAAVSICGAVNITIDPNDPQGSLAAISSSLGACQTALDDLLSAQDALTAAQNELTAAAEALVSLLAQWEDELASNPTTTTPGTPTTTTTTTTPSTETPTTTTPTGPGGSVPQASTPDTTTPSGPQGGTGGAPTGAPSGGGTAPSGSLAAAETSEPTLAEVLAYQNAVDAAEVAVEAAHQAISQATIVSPIGGTVVAVDLAPGDAVTGASDAQIIVVQGKGGYEATASVSVDEIDRIAVGQPAELTPDGGGAVVAGQVVAISQVPDSSGATANYRVTVGLIGDLAQLRDGNVGDITIVVDTGDETVAVPTSAVTTTADGHTVDVVGVDGTVTTVQVDIGAVGSEWTELRGGVDVGQVVVLADLDEPLPGTATDTTNQTGTGTPGGFPGGGLPGRGGFPGGGAVPEG